MQNRGALALFIVCALGTQASADLATGREKLQGGDYKTAIAELSKVTGKDQKAARILLARAQLETGDYAAAEGTAAALAKGTDALAIEARILLDDIRFQTGRGADARKDLEQLYKDKPDDRGVRTALAEARYNQGAVVDAKALFDLTIKEFDAQKLNLDDAMQLYQLAIAAHYTSQFELANDSYRAALKLNPRLVEIGVRWADLFSRKYASEQNARGFLVLARDLRELGDGVLVVAPLQLLATRGEISACRRAQGTDDEQR